MGRKFYMQLLATLGVLALGALAWAADQLTPQVILALAAAIAGPGVSGHLANVGEHLALSLGSAVAKAAEEKARGVIATAAEGAKVAASETQREIARSHIEIAKVQREQPAPLRVGITGSRRPEVSPGDGTAR